MNVCGIDPGKPPKTVFAWRAAPFHVSCREPPKLSFDLVIAEKPSGVIRVNRTPASVVSPAFWGGAALFSIQATRRAWVSIEDWKRKLLGSAWNMKKEAACANFVQMFKLKGLDPLDDSDQDAIDAIAICEAGHRFTEKELKKWLVKF